MVIDVAITIVILVIASFGLGRNCADALSRPLGVLADLLTIATSATSSGIYWPNITRATRSRTTSTTGIIFVDLLVAIVVLAVAQFELWEDLIFTRPPISEDTRLCTSSTSPDILRVGLAFIAGASHGLVCAFDIVDISIAIVINAIADLGGRESDLCADAVVVFALKYTLLARAMSFGFKAFFAEMQYIVDATIAIFVGFALTKFFLGQYLSNTLTPFAIVASFYARLTNTLIFCAFGPRITGSSDIFIDLTVTIIIYTIANFRLGLDLTKALIAPFAILTGLIPCPTDTHIFRASGSGVWAFAR